MDKISWKSDPGRVDPETTKCHHKLLFQAETDPNPIFKTKAFNFPETTQNKKKRPNFSFTLPPNQVPTNKGKLPWIFPPFLSIFSFTHCLDLEKVVKKKYIYKSIYLIRVFSLVNCMIYSLLLLLLVLVMLVQFCLIICIYIYMYMYRELVVITNFKKFGMTCCYTNSWVK